MATAVVLFGRMNPPTIGHLRAIENLERKALEIGATPLLYLSPTHKVGPKSKNPLTFEDKCRLLGEVITTPIRNTGGHVRTIVQVLAEVSDSYDDVILLGDGAMTSVDWDKYNGVDYHFNSITTDDTGYRSTTGDMIESATATRARQMVMDGDFDGFSVLIATEPVETWELVSRGLGLTD